MFGTLLARIASRDSWPKAPGCDVRAYRQERWEDGMVRKKKSADTATAQDALEVPDRSRPVSSGDLSDAVTRSSDQLDSLGDEKDLKDATAILTVFRGLLDIRDGYKSFSNRLARLTVQHLWEEPRKPRSPDPDAPQPIVYPWSPDARKAAIDRNTVGNLVFEHTTPLVQVCDEIFQRLADPDFDQHAMLDHLREIYRGLCFVVITKADDKKLTNAGWRNTSPDPTDPWSRYKSGLGLGADDFKSLAADPEYKRARSERRRGQTG